MGKHTQKLRLTERGKFVAVMLCGLGFWAVLIGADALGTWMGVGN